MIVNKTDKPLDEAFLEMTTREVMLARQLFPESEVRVSRGPMPRDGNPNTHGPWVSVNVVLLDEQPFAMIALDFDAVKMSAWNKHPRAQGQRVLPVQPPCGEQAPGLPYTCTRRLGHIERNAGLANPNNSHGLDNDDVQIEWEDGIVRDMKGVI